MKGYHFTNGHLRDGSPVPPIGEWLEHTGPVQICVSGLHYSKHPLDALKYAPGSTLHLVEVENIVTRQEDKGVCRRRKILASVDAEEILRAYARRCALDVIHLWNAPAVVKEYLQTGDEKLRAAASAAAWDAAWSAAWSVVRSAARAAAWSAAWDAASAAARSAAWDAASAAASAAAWDAASAAARSAARASAWDAATKKYRRWFKEMVDAALRDAK